jgi:signal transduction histidine kinase
MLSKLAKWLMPKSASNLTHRRRLLLVIGVACAHVLVNFSLLPVVLLIDGANQLIPFSASLGLILTVNAAIIGAIFLIRSGKIAPGIALYMAGSYSTGIFAAWKFSQLDVSVISIACIFPGALIASFVLNSRQSAFLAAILVLVSFTIAVPAMPYSPSLFAVLIVVQFVVAACIYLNARIRELDDFDLENERQTVLRQSKLAGLGELAASITHEIRNPLTVMMTSAEMVELRHERGQIQLGTSRPLLTSIRDAGVRINNIIEGLRKYSRGDSGEIQRASLASIAEDTVMMTGFRVKQADVRFGIGGELVGKELNCNPVQVVQALVNLINNAVDAVTGKPEAWVQLDISHSSDNVSFRLTDSGNGLNAEQQVHLFDAFYTTKASGTGLGLSMVQRIAQAHGGSIRYDAVQGHTSFVLELPTRGQHQVAATTYQAA